MPMHSANVYYVRHGENEATISREFSHRVVDHPLTDRGVEQARRLAAFFAAGLPVAEPVYSSPLRRAVQTAEILAERLGVGVTIVENFRELNVGELDGRSDAEAWARYEAVLESWYAGHGDEAFPGGEDHGQLVDRVRRGLAEVVRGRDREAIVVVAHGGVMRAALEGLIPGTRTPETDMENCAITELALRLPDPDRADELTGSLVCWSQQPELAALRPGTGRRRALAHQEAGLEGSQEG